MNQKEMRQIALGAVRSEVRSHGWEPKEFNADEAILVLDDIYRIDPEIIASIWYNNASDNQIRQFKQEWRQWKQTT